MLIATLSTQIAPYTWTIDRFTFISIMMPTFDNFTPLSEASLDVHHITLAGALKQILIDTFVESLHL